jgi:glucose-6-phosphate isomerase
VPASAGSPVSVDTTFAFDAALGAGRGVAADAVSALAANAPLLLATTRDERAAGKLPFLDLPSRADLLAPVRQHAAALRPSTTDVLVVGIGGSSRGAQALAGAARADGRGSRGRPRLHVLDTVDPRRARDLLATLPAKSTAVVAVSKAGTTLETVAGLLVVEAWMEKALGKARARARTAYVCGEEPNPMRARAVERDVACFPVPKGVGGRFSVLSPVGLLPAALMGLDVRAVLSGAAAVASRCLDADPAKNPALALALVHRAAEAAGRTSAVFLPYADALQPYALWWEQLVAESVGKKAPSGPVGIVPLPGVGPSDQHSLLQLLQDGPDRSLVVFVEVEDRVKDSLKAPKGGESLSVASGQRLGAILAAEREATEMALAEAGRPSVTIRVPDTRERSLGALLYLYEVATMWWGRLSSVDPFDQPAVERGKVLTRASLTGSPADAVAALARHRSVPRRLSL